jgi:hypothetical protein
MRREHRSHTSDRFEQSGEIKGNEMSRNAGLAAALLLMAGATNAFATVGGQTYIIDVTTTSSGSLKAEMEFVDGAGPDDSGQVGIDIKNAGDYTGFYTTAPKPTVVTNFSVSSVAPSDGFFSSFSGSAIDLKQAGGVIGKLAQKLALPGTMIGSGFSTSGDLFFFTGTEKLP